MSELNQISPAMDKALADLPVAMAQSMRALMTIIGGRAAIRYMIPTTGAFIGRGKSKQFIPSARAVDPEKLTWRSARLARSLSDEANAEHVGGPKNISTTGLTVSGRLGTEVPYAWIHEQGGTIHIPEIVPRSKKALHFFIGEKEIFAKKVRAHDVVMPARPFLSRALTDPDTFDDGQSILLSHVDTVLRDAMTRLRSKVA